MRTTTLKTKAMSILLAIVMLLGMLPMSAFAADLQTNADGAFLLYTSDDLKAFADYVNGGNYDADAILMDNITYEGTASIDTASIGTADIARTDYDNGYTVSNIKGYSGVFDGNGYTITMPADMYLFGAIDGATVNELTVSGGNKAIVAYMASGTMFLCNNRSTISGWAYCGGIVDIVGAESSTSTSDAVCVIRGCANYGNVNVNWNVGGIVGAARGKNVLIDCCANYGKFNLGTGRYVGGIAGKLTDGATVNYCFDSSTRSRVFSGDYGIAYLSNSTISNSFHVNGGTQTGATKISGLTDDVLNMLNQNPSGIKWSADGTLSDRWNITFDANGGSGIMENNRAVGDYTLPECNFDAPNGYKFSGWATSADGPVISEAAITVAADITLYAIWEKIPADAPTVEAGSDLTLTHKGYTDKQISVSVTEKDGYTYSYQWYDASTDQPISGAINAAYTLPNDLAAGSYSYYCTVTAKRDDNGETNSSTSFDIDVTVNKATLTADDFNFKGPDILVFHPANFKRATITPKDGVTGVGEITVQYFDEQGQPHSYADDAGTYTVKINVAEGDNYLAADGLTADGWTFTITKGEQDAPTGLASVAETICGKNDGKITGVYDEMEYRNVNETDADYKAITGYEVTGLAAGTYFVRLKETDNLLASPPVTVTVAAGRKLTVTLPQNQIGYTLTAEKTDLEWHGSTTLAFGLADGYSKTGEFSVSATGATLTDNGNGTYTISNAEDNVTVTGNGVADTTAPEAEISISTNRWTEFLNDITFGQFFKETQDVTITATDKGSGVDKIYYLISDDKFTEQAVETLVSDFWTEYDAANKPSIAPDKECIVYVKVIDKAQNVKFISSDGLVFDATAPTLEGIENGKTYYGDLTVIIPADQFGDIDKVTLDGETMTFAEGTYGRIPADNQEHTVVATDKAGNETVYKITVYKIYEVTFKHPTFELGFPVNYGVSFNEAHPDTVQDMIAAKEHHTFIGWYESTDGGETLKDTPYDFGAKVTGDVTLYPLFEIYTYTVTYKANGEVVGTVEVEHGADATAPAIPEKEGYTQTAPTWDKDGKNITADTEISAVYTINEYTITLLDENGVYKTLTYKHGEKVTMPEAPTKDGYTVKWETTIDKATGNTTVKAVYTEIPATDKPGAPQTGDNSHMALWFALLFISGGAVITLTVCDRKRRTKKN